MSKPERLLEYAQQILNIAITSVGLLCVSASAALLIWVVWCLMHGNSPFAITVPKEYYP